MTQWLNPRIWRSPRADFYHDEPLHALGAYTEDELYAIRDAGFDSIWLRGKLGDLMDSAVFPQLNQPQADIRRQNLKELISRARRQDIGVWLYFNEPLALPSEHPFWSDHGDLRGAVQFDFDTQKEVNALCTSQ